MGLFLVGGTEGELGDQPPSEIHLGVGQTLQNELLDVKVTWRAESGERRETLRVLPGRYQVVLGETECRKAMPLDSNLKEVSCRVVDPGS